MKYVRIFLILKSRISESKGKSGAAHGSLKIGYKALDGGRVDAGAYDTPGGIVKCNARGVAILMEVHADPNPQGDFVSFDGRGQVVERSSRRCDHRSNEDSEGEGEASYSDVKWLGESILSRRVC